MRVVVDVVTTGFSPMRLSKNNTISHMTASSALSLSQIPMIGTNMALMLQGDDDDDGSTIQYDDIRFVNEFATKFPSIVANVSISCTWW
jgi:hypothetical protein